MTEANNDPATWLAPPCTVEGDPGWFAISVILEAAAAVGCLPPPGFMFSAGQLFWQDRKLVEVRLAGRVIQNPDVREESVYWQEVLWASPTPPKLRPPLNDGGRVELDPADVARTHLSAMVTYTAENGSTPLLAVRWDLGVNSRIDATVSPAPPGFLVCQGHRQARPVLVKGIAESRYLLDAPTRIDKVAARVVSFANEIKLPRRWSSIPRWEDLVRDEVERLQSEHGEAAFVDLRTTNKDPSARGPLLRRRYGPGSTEPTVELSKEALEHLTEEVGYRGVRRVILDKDKVQREYLVKRCRAGPGHIEVRLSWYNAAWPLVDEGRSKAREEIVACKRSHEGLLFEHLTSEERDTLDRRQGWLDHIEDARAVMGHILRVFGRDGLNPVHIPAWELRSLLECEKARGGFERVQGCLRPARSPLLS